MPIDPRTVLAKLDEALHKQDYATAEAILADYHRQGEAEGDAALILLIENEQMGLFRRLGRGADALAAAKRALARLSGDDGIEDATTCLNAATVHKSLGEDSEALALYSRARTIYERRLPRTDPRLASLYNNMATALVALGRFDEARTLYALALSLLAAREDGCAEAAITYLNVAEAIEAERGLLAGEGEILACLDRAREQLEAHPVRDAAYAFACEKCAPGFSYYGRFAYAAELEARAEAYYAGN